MSQNIFQVIDTLDNAAKIPALRAITHSMMAKCIGAIRQHIRLQQRPTNLKDGTELNAERNEERGDGLDARNAHDENTRSVADIANAMGFPSNVSPMEQAEIYHEVYEWAKGALLTLSQSRFDQPLDLDGMLAFMTTRSQPLPEVLLNELAKIVKTKPEVIAKMHEMQEMQDREKLIAMLPEIKATFLGFDHLTDTDGYALREDERSDGFNNLPAIAKHQLGVTVVDKLGKAKEQVMMRAMRTRRLTELASIPLIEDGTKVVADWVQTHEKAHEADIHAAIEQGLQLRSLEDVAPAF